MFIRIYCHFNRNQGNIGCLLEDNARGKAMGSLKSTSSWKYFVLCEVDTGLPVAQDNKVKHCSRACLEMEILAWRQPLSKGQQTKLQAVPWMFTANVAGYLFMEQSTDHEETWTLAWHYVANEIWSYPLGTIKKQRFSQQLKFLIPTCSCPIWWHHAVWSCHWSCFHSS